MDRGIRGCISLVGNSLAQGGWMGDCLYTVLHAGKRVSRIHIVPDRCTETLRTVRLLPRGISSYRKFLCHVNHLYHDWTCYRVRQVETLQVALYIDAILVRVHGHKPFPEIDFGRVPFRDAVRIRQRSLFGRLGRFFTDAFMDRV